MQAVGNPRQRSELIEKDSHMSIRRQCRPLHIHRSMIYYDLSEETAENLELMKKLDHLYLEDPSAGSRRMSSYLRRQTGTAANRKRVRRLMRKMGIEAIYPRKRTTIPGGPSGIYPYRGLIRYGAPISRSYRCAGAICICLLSWIGIHGR